MKRAAGLFQWLSLVAILVALVQPIGAVSAVAQATTATGDLQIVLGDGAGGVVGGACYAVTDANGNSISICDDDGDGIAYVSALPTGSVAVSETSGPAGYYLADPGYATVIEASVATLNLAAYAVPVEPAPEEPTATPTPEPPATETPVVVPSETPTPEPPATETATIAPVTEPATVASPTASPETKSARSASFAAAAASDDLFTVNCSFDANSKLSSFQLVITKQKGTEPNYDPNLNVVATPYDNQMNPLAPITYHNYDSSQGPNNPDFADKPWRQISFVVTWPDGLTGAANAACNTSQNSTSIKTQAYGINGMIPDDANTPSGPVYDTATLAGNPTINASGTATYTLYKGGSCTPANQVAQYVVNVSGGKIDDSPSYTPTTPGLYNWLVTYSGDSINAASSSSCGEESFYWGKTTTSITTVMKTSGNSVIPHNGTVPLQTTVKDTAILSGATGNVTGTITYKLYATTDCSGTPVTSTASVNGSTIGESATRQITTAGTYNWVVEYSGDTNNNPAVSGCGSETFSTGKATPSISTVMKNRTTGQTIPQDGTASFGQSVYDTTTLSGATANYTGSVTYTLYSDSSCNSVAATFGPYTISTPGVAPDSGDFTVANAGSYRWRVSYSGDSQNEAATSSCGSERFSVNKKSPSITTTMFNASNVEVPNNGSIPSQGSIKDTATLTGVQLPLDTSKKVTFKLYKGTACSGTPVATYSVNVNADGTIPATPLHTFAAGEDGTYNWQATYEGDANNNAATSACNTEQFFVGKGVSGITTQVKRSSNNNNVNDNAQVPVDNAYYDTATLTGVTPNAGGTVTYFLYSGGSCSGNTPSGTLITSFTVTVTNGIVPASPAYTFDMAGTYQWQAVYSGDANNQGSASACASERMRIIKRAPSLTTTMKAGDGTTLGNGAKVAIGSQIYDTAALSNAATTDFSGTITYTLYSDADCTTQVYTSGALAIPAGGPIPNSGAPQSIAVASTYSWIAVYSGDAKNNSANSGCGSEYVHGQSSPTVTTKMVDKDGAEITNNSTIAPGTQIGDTAVITGSAAKVTGKVVFKLYAGSDCSGSVVATYTVNLPSNGSGAVPPTPLYTANFTGTYNWQAEYQGDDLNPAVKSACNSEQFSVAGDASIVTIMKAQTGTGNSTIPHGSSVTMPATVFDSAILLGVPANAGGTITYELFKSADCSGSPVLTSTKNVTNGVAQDSAGKSLVKADIGIYNWVVTYKNGAGDVVATSGCGSETFQAIPEPTRTVTVSCTYLENGNSSFRFIVPPLQSGTPNYDPDLIVVANPLNIDNSPAATVTYHNYDSSQGPNNPIFANQPWRSISVQVTWPDGGTGTGSAGCNTSKMTPSFTTVIVTQSGQGTTPVANGTMLEPGAVVGDTATYTNGTVDLSGTVIYRLYRGGGCEPGQLVQTSTKIIGIKGTIPASDLFTITDPGDYQWTIEYQGDQYNKPFTSACGDEYFSIGSPELEIAKTADAATVNAGDQIGYTITLTNSGSGIATGVTLADTLPVKAGLSWSIDSANSSANCSISGGAVNCAARDLDPGASITVHITSPTTRATCGEIDNSATYASTNAGTGSSDEVKITVNCPSLTITKTADAATVNAGDQIGYTITVTNAGPGVARGVTLTDTLPNKAGLSWSISPTVQGCTITAGTLSCTARDLAAEESLTVHIVSPTTAASCTGVTNAASYGSTNGGSGETPNVPITINCPDLKINKTADKGTVNAGESIGFTVTLTNDGPGIARAVTLTDTLPANAGLNWSVDTANSSANCTITSGVLNCAARDLAANGSITVHVISPTTSATCGEVNNEASYGSTNGGTGTSNEAKIVVNCPDVTVTKIADKGTVSAGDQIGFTMVVTNNGPGVAKSVTLTDTLPATPGTSWAISPAVQGCAITNGTLSCAFGDMAAEATRTVHIVSQTTADSCGTVSNTVRVAATNEPESAQGNNSATATVEVDCPNVVVKKTALTPSISAGDDLKFSIEVSNTGAGIARNVTLTDGLPAGIAWSVDNTQQCSISGGVLSCSFGDLAPDAKKTVVVTGKTDPADCGTVTNTARTAATNEPDSSKVDNSSTATANVLCPDVTVRKTAANGTINAGDNATFSIKVSNSGAGIARDVRLLDVLPLGFAWQISPSVQGCAIIFGTLSCAFGDMAPQASVTVTVTAPTAYAQCRTIVNIVLVSATNEADRDTLNNLSSASIAINCSDLKLTKTPDQETVSAGTTIGFTLSVTNKGDGEARNVVLTDVLPTMAGLNWTISPSVQGCAITNGTLTCDFGTLAKDATKSVHTSSTTTAAICGVVDNSATIRASNAPDAVASGSVTVNCPNVTIIKRAVNGTINASETMSFQITVTNNGLGDATGVMVADPLPASVTNWTADNASCTIANGSMTCEFGTIPSGESRTVTVSGTATAEVCGLVINTATVSATNEPESATGDNFARSGVTVLCPDLQITKTAGNGTINAGDSASFTITVRNAGPGEAKNVTITDNLPAGIDWKVDPAVQGCSITNGTLICQVGTLVSTASFSVTVTGETSATNCGTLNNTASTAASNEPTDATENNSASAAIVVNCPDLKIEKSAANGTISAGETASYTVKVTNLGPGTAYDVVMTDELPAGISWAISPSVTGCAITDGKLACSFDQLASGASVTVTVTGKTDATLCGTLSNTATTSASNEPKDDTGDNSSTATMQVSCPDLKIEKSASAESVNAGDKVGFTIKVTNLGPGTAYDVVVNDTLPAGIGWTIDPSVEGCAIADGKLSCSIASMAAETSISVTVTGTTDATLCGPLTNTASTSASNEPKDDTGNNTSTATMQVNCPDLKIEKKAVKESISAEDDAAFTIVVTNLGPGTAYDVTVTDQLPAGIDWTIDPSAEDCAITDGTLTCSVDELAMDAMLTVTVTGKTDKTDCGTLTNTATISASNEPTDKNGNNSSTATVQVNCPDLTVMKVATSETISAGDQAGFTITVTNNGTGDAYDAKVTDQLPAGIDWTIDPAVAGCDIGDGALSCAFEKLAAGESKTITITGETDATNCGQLSNMVTVSAHNEPDDKTGDNSSTATMQINCPDVAVVKTADAPVVIAGDKVGFGITVSNIGAGDSYGVTVTDHLPAGVDWAIDGGTAEGCAIADGTLSCAFDKLAAGASVTVHISGTTAATSCGLMTNTVYVNATNEAEGGPDNNRSYANVTIACDNVVVAKYLCVTDKADSSVEFVVTTPRGDDGSRGCAIGPGVTFTISGDSLAKPIHLTTGENGQFTATLLTGSYTLTEYSTGASVEFEVVTNQPTLINVYNLTPEPTVEVTINKFWCKQVENGVLITVNETAGLKGCTPGATIVQLDGGAPFRINDNGTITILVSVGEHTISEPSANASMTFTATPGEPVTIRIYNQITEPKPGPSFPNTGSGIGGGDGDNDALILAMLLTSLIMLAGGTYLIRRRESDLRDAA